MTPSAASAGTTVTICLTYASSYCADVKDGQNVSGQPIWLYEASGSRDYHWILITGVSCVAGTGCYNFEDAQDTSLCLSTTVGREIELGTCGGRGSWYSEGGNLLGNGAYGASYTLMVRSVSDEVPLTALPKGESGYWESWNY